MARENYFILLDIDPTEEDPSRIEAAIATKQREWSTMRNHPTKGAWANQSLGQIPQIRRVMVNIEQREAEAEAAVQIALNRQGAQFADFDKAIETIASKGFILEVELESLLKREAFKTFSRKDVEARINVPITREEAPKEKIEPLETTLAGQIERNLKIIEKSDLYDFLELSRSTTIPTLQNQTDERYRAARLIANKDTILTATVELLGHCKIVFKDEDTQKRYDKTLDLQRFYELNKLIEYAGADREIAAGEFEYLLKEGARMGLDKNEIIAHIKKYATDRRWSVQLPDGGSAILESVTCGNCNALNTPKAKVCNQCGFPLEVNCPRCKLLNKSSTKNCSKCGYAIGDMPNAVPLLRDAKAALAEGQYVEAGELFNQANTYWENHPDYISGMERIKRFEEDHKSELIDAFKEEIRQIIAEDELEKAFSKLERNANPKSELLKDLLMLKRSSRDCHSSSIRGVISRDQFQMEKNKITHSFLTLINLFDQDDLLIIGPNHGT